MKLTRKIRTYILRKLRVLRKGAIRKQELELIGDKNFVIVSDNCWGGQIYQWLDKPYNTPFVGLGIYGDCYIKLLANFDYYMGLDLMFKPQCETKHPHIFKEEYYPMGILGDIEIHFVHYASEEEAAKKWLRRTNRMLEVRNKDNFFFKLCNDWKDDCQYYKQFHAMPYKNKVSFVPDDKHCFADPSHISVHERHRTNKSQVPNGVGLFKISFLYFDLAKWLATCRIKRKNY